MVNERCLHCSVETDPAERQRVTTFRGFYCRRETVSAIGDQCEKAPARLDMVTPDGAHLSAPCVRHNSCGSKMW